MSTQRFIHQYVPFGDGNRFRYRETGDGFEVYSSNQSRICTCANEYNAEEIAKALNARSDMLSELNKLAEKYLAQSERRLCGSAG